MNKSLYTKLLHFIEDSGCVLYTKSKTTNSVYFKTPTELQIRVSDHISTHMGQGPMYIVTNNYSNSIIVFLSLKPQIFNTYKEFKQFFVNWLRCIDIYQITSNSSDRLVYADSIEYKKKYQEIRTSLCDLQHKINKKTNKQALKEANKVINEKNLQIKELTKSQQSLTDKFNKSQETLKKITNGQLILSNKDDFILHNSLNTEALGDKGSMKLTLYNQKQYIKKLEESNKILQKKIKNLEYQKVD